MIFHITFYRNTISFSVNHNFSSAYSALSDTFGGHFWANKLLRTRRVIKVTIPPYKYKIYYTSQTQLNIYYYVECQINDYMFWPFLFNLGHHQVKYSR